MQRSQFTKNPNCVFNCSIIIVYSTPTTTYLIDYLDTRGNRVIHSALLHSLTPGTLYDIVINFPSAAYGPYAYKSVGVNATMVNGGDLGNTHTATETWEAFKSLIDLDVIQIGGDIAYDDGMAHCYNCWDIFFEHYMGMWRSLGRVVPLLLTVGNHDVGMAENPQLLFPRTQGLNVRTPLYFVYFAQETDINNNIPQVEEPPVIVIIIGSHKEELNIPRIRKIYCHKS